MKIFNRKSPYLFLSVIVVVLVIFRFLLLWNIPLLDKTETRYAEIARLMYETNQWIVLQYDYGVSFWGKPPLSTWLSAMSFNLFGVNELSARLPSFILCLAIIFLLFKIKTLTKEKKVLIAFVLLTTPEFLLHMGVISTDCTLLFSTTLVMISFWKAITSSSKSSWNYLFFVGLGLGLLSKGPIVFILTGVPIFVWCILDYKERFLIIWKKLPWITGLLLMALIAFPWYYLMEKGSPGFINYFIIGEHFYRFISSEWSGDRYGFAKSQPFGMVWLFLLAFGFPWFQFVLYKFWKNKNNIWKDKWVSFLILWILGTPLFFTFSSNTIHTYILPSIVPIALLVAHWWEFNKKWVITSLVFPTLCIILSIILPFTSYWNYNMNTDKSLILNQKINTKNIPVYYWYETNYSGRFYAERKIGVIRDNKALDSVLSLNENFYLMIQHKQEYGLNKNLKKRLIPLDSNYKRKIYANFKLNESSINK